MNSSLSGVEDLKQQKDSYIGVVRQSIDDLYEYVLKLQSTLDPAKTDSNQAEKLFFSLTEPLKTALSTIKTAHSTYFSKLNEFSKTINQNFKYNPQSFQKLSSIFSQKANEQWASFSSGIRHNFEQNSSNSSKKEKRWTKIEKLVVKSILEFMIREGYFEEALILTQESGISIHDDPQKDSILIAQYKQMHEILNELKIDRKCDKLWNWVSSFSISKIQKQSMDAENNNVQDFQPHVKRALDLHINLLFSIHELRFIEKVQSKDLQGAIFYARKHFSDFQTFPECKTRIAKLMGSLPFISSTNNEKKESLSASIFSEEHISNIWEEIEQNFKELFFISLHKPVKDPLYCVVSAGNRTLPNLLKLVTIIKGNTSKDKEKNKDQMEIDEDDEKDQEIEARGPEDARNNEENEEESYSDDEDDESEEEDIGFHQTNPEIPSFSNIFQGTAPASASRGQQSQGDEVAVKDFLNLENISQKSDQLTVETPLGPEFIFHSIFTCPVSKEISSSKENPPLLLPCNHVIVKTSVLKLSKGKPFKCPYCPQICKISDCLEVKF